MNAETLTTEEISRRIVTGMGLVYDLFQEVNSLLRLLAQGLENSKADIRPLTLRGSVLPRSKKTKSIVDWFLKLDMGLLATVGAGDSHESEEPDDDASDATSDAEQEEKADKAVIKIAPETRYLGVRVILFDPLARDPAKFTPVLVAGLIGSIQRPAKGAKRRSGDTKPETNFTLRRAAIKQLVKQLTADVKAGQSIGGRAGAAGDRIHSDDARQRAMPLGLPIPDARPGRPATWTGSPGGARAGLAAARRTHEPYSPASVHCGRGGGQLSRTRAAADQGLRLGSEKSGGRLVGVSRGRVVRGGRAAGRQSGGRRRHDRRQLAGAYWGESGVPQSWRDGLAGRDLLERALRSLLS